MKKQFDKYNTFFDIGIEQIEKREFVTLCCTISNVIKKRSYRNRAILKYLKNKQLTEEEKKLCYDVLTGKIYKDDHKRFEHCELCDGIIQNNTKLSEKYSFWDIIKPTRPYYPGSIMLILKERNDKKIEDIQQLSEDEFNELKQIIIDLYNIVKNKITEYEIVGINVLFNQISKSQLCIHGHIEFMIKDAEKKNIGYQIKKVRNWDKLTEIINEEIQDKDVIKVKEGIKIDLDNTDFKRVKSILDKYDGIIKKYIEYGKSCRDEHRSLNKNKLQNIFLHNFTPSPVNYIYITFYRNKLILSSIPELILENADINSLNEENEYDLYTLKINQYATEKKDMLLKHESPFIRPSTKVEKKMCFFDNVEKLNTEIINIINDKYSDKIN